MDVPRSAQCWLFAVLVVAGTLFGCAPHQDAEPRATQSAPPDSAAEDAPSEGGAPDGTESDRSAETGALTVYSETFSGQALQELPSAELIIPEPEPSGAEPEMAAAPEAESVPVPELAAPSRMSSPPAFAPLPAPSLPPRSDGAAPPRTSAVKDKGFTRETVYFATDRARNSRATSAKEMFSSRRGDLEFGVCEVSVPDTHVDGELEGKKWYQWREDPRKHILILDPLKILGRNEFVREVKGRVARGKGREVLIFVHGYNVSFESALQRTAQLAHDLEFPGVAICYSWPSGNSGNYATDWTNAEWTTPHCVEFLELVATQLGAAQVDLIAHSMGSRVLTNSLKETSARWGSLSDRPLFHQVVLAAPDIDAEIFRTQIAPAIRRSGQRLTVYTSTRDRALQLSESVNGYARLGSGGKCMTHLKELPWLECVDATALLDDSWLGLRHSYYGDSPQLIQDLQQVLRGTRAPDRGLAHAPDGSYVVR